MNSCARNIAVVFLMSVALAGCFDKEPSEETMTVEWYMENGPARAEKLSQCNDNPGELKETPNCQNAVRAEEQSSSGSLRKIENW